MEQEPKLRESTTDDPSEDEDDPRPRKPATTSSKISDDTEAPSRSSQWDRKKKLTIGALALALVGTVAVVAGVLVMTGTVGSSTSANLANELSPTQNPKVGNASVPVPGPGVTGLPQQTSLQPTTNNGSPTKIISPAPSLPLDPSAAPSDLPSYFPSSFPSSQPSSAPTGSYPFPIPPLDSLTGVTRFYGIADIPYNSSQLAVLQEQMDSVPSDAEFIVHLGDIRNADKDPSCVIDDYTVVAETLKRSPVPVFIIPGDNEWNDCAGSDEAWSLWVQVFMFFEDHWAHNFTVKRMPGRNETFAFIHKGSLFIGLNIVGGRVQNATEWQVRLSTEAEWVMGLIRYYDSVTDVGRVVIFSHANATENHVAFYDPFKDFVVNELQERIPIVNFNGDGHVWRYQPTFFAPATSLLRIMLTGEGVRPMHQITINATNKNATFEEAFHAVY